MSRLASALFATIMLGACAVDDQLTASVEALGGGACPSWGCGGDNSPVMGPYWFWEGNTEGKPNKQKMVFKEFIKAGTSYEAQIVRDQLRAYHRSSNTYLTGTALQGGYFRVVGPDGNYDLMINKVRPKALSDVRYWTGAPEQIETYELGYRPEGSGWLIGETLCNNPPQGRENDGPGRTWKAPLEAMLFTGDRYDGDARTVTDISPVTTRGYFNIACAGSALAKLHLNRFTSVGSDATHSTSQRERQALMKAYSSDLCGDGTAFTVKGTKLHHQKVNAGTPAGAGWSQLTGTEFAFEARWNHLGALCLDTHRLGDEYTAQIALECGAALPPCHGHVAALTFPADTLLVTAVPDDPF